jgi:hypothetical protein
MKMIFFEMGWEEITGVYLFFYSMHPPIAIIFM